LFRTLERTTAAAPKTAAPVQLTTPELVYAFGTYCSNRLRGVDSEIATAARKKEIYRERVDAIQRMAGRLGLKVGAIAE
jgi:hypothetical protein